jgi:monooxygenase
VRAFPELRHSGATAGHRWDLGCIQVAASPTRSPRLCIYARPRYPGVRSDSDMHTLGYKCVQQGIFLSEHIVTPRAVLSHGPLKRALPTATGARSPFETELPVHAIVSIMNYLRETVAENDLEQRIALGVKVMAADWDPSNRSWNLVLSITQESGAQVERKLSCSILYMCSGYFSYDTPHDPKFPGFENFRGLTLHPQFWPSPCPPLQGKQVFILYFTRLLECIYSSTVSLSTSSRLLSSAPEPPP